MLYNIISNMLGEQQIGIQAVAEHAKDCKKEIQMQDLAQ